MDNAQMQAFRAAHFAATGRDLHTDVPLSNVALAYRPQNIIADLVMPVVSVGKQSDYVTEFFRKDQLRVEQSRRAPGTEANRVTRDVGSKQFFCKNYALKTGVTLEDYNNADPIKRAELYDNAARFLVDKLSIGWERRISSLVTTTNVGSSAGVASAWNGAGNPVGNINAAIDVVKDLTGYKPNRILFGERAWKSFRRDSTVRNIVYGTNNGGGFVSEAKTKDLFEVEHVLVSRAAYNTANEAAAESLSQVMADHVLVYYAPTAPRIDSPSWAYTYRWEVPGVPSLQAERLPYDPKTKQWDVEVGYYQDERITGSEYGYMLISVNSST
jgi:hypothetical protein